MKNKRKFFIISWFYFIGSIITMLVPIVCIYFVMSDYDDLSGKILMLCIFGVSFIFEFVVFGIAFIQWVAVSDKGITARCLFGVIRKVAWEEVEEIKCIVMSYHHLDPKMSWFIFVDKIGGELYTKSPFNYKGRYIRIKASKKNKLFLLSIQPDLKFVLHDQMNEGL